MNKVKQTHKTTAPFMGKGCSYTDVIEWLDANWKTSYGDGKSVERMKQLDTLCANPSKKITTITINGTNGKSLTAYYTAKLLRQEGLSVGVFYAPHLLTYNERIVLNSEPISNKQFTDVAGEILQTVQSNSLNINSYELLLQTALNFFAEQKVDVVLLEAGQHRGIQDATALCNPTILAVTRITAQEADALGKAPESIIKEYASVAQKGTYVTCADQNKENLNTGANRSV